MPRDARIGRVRQPELAKPRPTAHVGRRRWPLVSAGIRSIASSSTSSRVSFVVRAPPTTDRARPEHRDFGRLAGGRPEQTSP